MGNRVSTTTQYPRLSSSQDVWAWAQQLVQILTQRDAVVTNAIIPVGASVLYRGAVPTGFLLENGASVTKAKYPALFAVIGYAFGGAGANFTLPNSGANTGIKY